MYMQSLLHFSCHHITLNKIKHWFGIYIKYVKKKKLKKSEYIKIFKMTSLHCFTQRHHKHNKPYNNISVRAIYVFIETMLSEGTFIELKYNFKRATCHDFRVNHIY